MKVQEHNDDGVSFAPMREATLLRACRGPHIIEMIEVFSTPSATYIALERMAMSLHFYVFTEHKGGVALDLLMSWSQQMLKGLEFLHECRNVMHRDLKPDNILVSKDGTEIKLGDFGSARMLTDFSKPHYRYQRAYTLECSTRDYECIEKLCKNSRYGKPVDMWSVAVIVLCLAKGVHPFRSLPLSAEFTPEMVFDVLGKPSVTSWWDGEDLHVDGRPAVSTLLPPDFPEHFVRLIDQLLSYDSTERPTAKEALAMLEEKGGRKRRMK